MTRVRFVAVVCCAAMLLAANVVNAQCSSCAQGVAPVFNQSYASPASSYVAAPYYNASAYSQPISYMQPQASYASPVSSGCSSCGTANYAAPQATYAMAPVSTGCSSCNQGSPMYVQPVSSGCSSCGQGTYTSMPAVGNSGCGCSSCAQPVSMYSVPVNTGCSACATTVQPQRLTRVRVLGQRRNNNCNTCN